MAEAPTEVVNINVEDPSAATTQDAEDPAAQFRGVGVNFKAKLIGIDDVGDSRGDKMCQESILKLKAAVKVTGQHKQKILVNISLEGLKILDLMTGEVQHSHPVNKISFVARDLTDRRAFGYIFSGEDGKHKLFGIKTAKVAETLVLSLRDLFQVVYDLRKKELDGPPQQPQAARVAAVGMAGTQGNILGGNQPTGAAGQAKLGEMLQTIESIDQFDASNMLNDHHPAQQAVTPGTPATPATPDLFGSEGFGAPARTESLSDDLQSLSIAAEQPPPNHGTSMTNDQILNQFGQGGQAGGMMPGMQVPAYQQQYNPLPQQRMMPPQQQQMFQQQQSNPLPQQQQQQMFQQQQQSNPFGINAFASQPQQQQQMFQPQQQQQLPQVPPRTGQMFQPQQQQPQQPASLFGAPVLSPAPQQANKQQAAAAPQNDPFGDILGGMGGGGAAAPNPKDMFKGFEMAKPAGAATSGIDNYLLNSKGVLPLDQQQQPPTAMPRNTDPQNQAASLFG